MLDRAQALLRHLLQGQLNRHMPGCAQAARLRLPERLQVDCGRHRVFGDFHEIDLLALQFIERGADLGWRADFDHPLPDRLDAFELGARGEYGRTFERARADLSAPVQHVLGHVA